MNMKFEDKYFDVLQNIEFAIGRVFQTHPELTDHDVDKGLNTLIRAYQAEQRERPFNPPKLSDLAQQVMDEVKVMCDWRLGKATFERDGQSVEIDEVKVVEVSEIIACLKRIRKSIRLWNKEGGRQGYLKFISSFGL